jgi:hypothetical protein
LIQELVLILDGRDGVVLASILFGASVFGSRRSLPEGFQESPLRLPVEAAGAAFLSRISGDFGTKNEPKRLRVSGVESMN